MKGSLIFICMLAAGLCPLSALEPDAVGMGVVFGNPAGVTAKLLYGQRAAAAGVNFDTDLTLYGDYLWNILEVRPRAPGGKAPVYLGVGLQVSPEEFGLRLLTGIAYWLPHSPVELFCDIIPVLRLSPGNSGGVRVSAGLRYYFKGV